MAVLADLLTRVRSELADQPKQFSKEFAGDGLNKDFSLGVKPVDVATLVVTVNGSPMANPDDFTVEDIHGVIHFVTAPPVNAVVKVEGVVFRYFTDTELCVFINTAVEQHTHNRTDSYGSVVTLSKIPAVEEYPLVILSVIEALWALATDAAFDIDISAPDGVMIPRSQRFSQLTSMINSRWDQYKQLCQALNIGLWKIEMGVLRRVSRTTNKLVPVYMPQEIDDSRRPERVYLQNDLYGRTPMPTTAQIYDIVFTQGDSWTATFDFAFALTDYNIKAQIRTYPNSPSLYATFTAEIDGTDNTKLHLSLTKSQTEYLPTRCFWDLQLTTDSDPDYELTPLKGQVFVSSQVTLD